MVSGPASCTCTSVIPGSGSVREVAYLYWNKLLEEGLLPYRLLEHTADIGFEVTAGSCGKLFAEAMKAMTEWARPVCSEEASGRFIRVRSTDITALLVDFLNEVLACWQIYREAYQELTVIRMSETLFEAMLHGSKITGAADEIKAVTYHGAKVEQLPDGTWSATLLMDI
jgi:SHS2 domain-containing protein